VLLVMGGRRLVARAQLFFFLSGKVGRASRRKRTKKKGGRSAGFGAEKVSFGGLGKKQDGGGAPPLALETNLEACADAEEEKRDERVLFSDWLIETVCFFFLFARVYFLRSQARFDLQPRR
jgi:hypothetical protein